MKEMYVITVSGGQYEDAWTWPEIVTDDLEKGQAYVNKMNNLSEQAKKAENQLSQFENDYCNKNPQPAISKHELKKVPKWKSGEKITQEMRDERAKLKLENDKIIKEANQPIQDWSEQLLLEKKQWLENNFSQEVREMVEKDEILDWQICPVKWLD